MQHLNHELTVSHSNSTNGELSLVKLHATLSFLMTQFLSHQCPKLSQFIVRHLSLMIEHPAVSELTDSRTMYLQLQQHWQKITESLLAQRKMLAIPAKTIH